MLTTHDYKAVIEKLDSAFGEKWREWLPETLEAAIESEWRGIEPIHFDRLLAIRNLIYRGQAMQSVDVFQATVNALNWNDVNHEAGFVPSPGQIVFAVKIMSDLFPGDIEFSDEVNRYVAKVFNSKMYVFIPESFLLPGAQPYIDKYDQSSELRDAVEAKWLSMMDGEWFDLEETAVDVQCARLLAIKKFCDYGGSGTPRDKSKALAKLILN